MTPQDRIAELKPCPFCGSDDLQNNGLECRIRCVSCQAEIALWDGDDAIAAWNRRATPDVAELNTMDNK